MAIHFNQTPKFKLNNTAKIKFWIKYVIEKQGFNLGKIYFTFCEDEELLKINQQFLNHNTYTDIITFDYCEKNKINGEIYISFERVIENAKKENELLVNELHRVIIHGILHLCGFKDKSPHDKRIMRENESKMMEILTSL